MSNVSEFPVYVADFISNLKDFNAADLKDPDKVSALLKFRGVHKKHWHTVLGTVAQKINMVPQELNQFLTDYKKTNKSEKKYKRKTQERPSRTNFEIYSEFFRHHLLEVNIDIMSERAMYFNKRDKKWTDIKEQISILKSFADDKDDIKASKIEDHLTRYGSIQRKRLLLDIPDWDRRDRLKEISEKVIMTNVSQQCFDQHLKQWGVNLFLRIKNPLNQNFFIIFTGEQGIGKDTLIENLTNGFGQFRNSFTVMKNERDNLMQLADNIVINFPEFDRTGSMSVAELKNMVTLPRASFRRPYERAVKSYDFRCSCIGSCNAVHDVLRDSTGNRRLKVFDISKIDYSYPSDNPMQIIAQWKYLYENNYQMDMVEQEEMKTYVEESSPETIEESVCELWDQLLSKRMNDHQIRNEVQYPSSEVLEIFEAIKKAKGIKERKLLSILKSTGRRTHTRNGKRYHLPLK